jgi:hypothetical protein
VVVTHVVRGFGFEENAGAEVIGAEVGVGPRGEVLNVVAVGVLARVAEVGAPRIVDKGADGVVNGFEEIPRH